MSEPRSEYIVVVAGTHVDGKDAVMALLSTSLNCPYIEGEYAHNTALSVARFQERHGYDFKTVYGRAWLSRMERRGLMYYSGDGRPGVAPSRCIALVSSYHMRRPSREAIKAIMSTRSIKVIFFMLQITRDVLLGRTIGAENPQLASEILREKAEDLKEPPEDETDALAVDSMQDVDSMAQDIAGMVKRQIGS